VSIRLDIRGIDDTIRRIAQHIGEEAWADIANTTEAYARKMANESAELAPLKDGALKNSIASSPEQVEPYTWEYGSDLPYATRQEYEHSTHSAFIRKSVWNNERDYQSAIERRVRNGR
jgi:hypothetical protein